MILQGIRIIVVDSGFEPKSSAPEVWCATNEPPHLPNLPNYLHSVTVYSMGVWGGQNLPTSKQAQAKLYIFTRSLREQLPNYLNSATVYLWSMGGEGGRISATPNTGEISIILNTKRLKSSNYVYSWLKISCIKKQVWKNMCHALVFFQNNL